MSTQLLSLHSLTAGLPEATVLISKSLTVVLHVTLIFSQIVL